MTVFYIHLGKRAEKKIFSYSKGLYNNAFNQLLKIHNNNTGNILTSIKYFVNIKTYANHTSGVSTPLFTLHSFYPALSRGKTQRKNTYSTKETLEKDVKYVQC